MVNIQQPNAMDDSEFFDGRILIEITAWDWNLHVGLSHPATPRKHRFEGGLNYSRGIEIVGKVRAPSAHRGDLVRVWLSPTGREAKFGGDGLNEVGRFYVGRSDAPGGGFRATLLLPESSLPGVLTCLSSIWKYVDIWTECADSDEQRITAFSFSAAIHPNLAEWAGPGE